MADLAYREVDADERRVRTRALPRGGLPASLFEQPQAEPDDQAGVLGQVDEPVRGEQPELGVVPAGQRLHAVQGAVGEADQGLVDEAELVAVDGGGHGRGQPVPGHVAGVAVGVEDGPPVLAVGLGPAHGDVRGPHQLGRVGTGHRPLDDAGAGRDRQGVVPDQDRCAEHRQGPVGDLDRVVEAGGAGDQERELVAVQPGDQVPGVGGQLAEPPGDGDQQPVADLVAEAVVDQREPVQVQDAHADPGVRCRVGGHAGEVLGEQGPVGQPGQRVVLGGVA